MFHKILYLLFKNLIDSLVEQQRPIYVTCVQNRAGVIHVQANKSLPVGSHVLIYAPDFEPQILGDLNCGHSESVHATGIVYSTDEYSAYIKAVRLNTEVKPSDLVKVI